MDAVSYSHSAKQAQRIEKFIENPDSNSGIVTVPKVIEAGESVTVPAGRVAVLPNVQVDGTLNVEGDGEIFIPAGATLSKVVETEGNQDIDGIKNFLTSPTVPTPTTWTQAVNKDYADTKQSKYELAYNVDTSSYIPNTLSSGAIIEKGINGNGEYIKYADGTLICRNIALLSLKGYNNGVYNLIAFPHYFINGSYSLITHGWRSVDDNIMFFLRGGNIHNSSGFNITTSTTNAELGVQFDYVAIGRWK